ncbi:MAG: anthranilate synthase component I [Nitrosomonadaceae bacterium]|nr:anthranilate synthase component I [Nitrosomonadaceae bacterium]|tara:strand:+ start:877 stop:2349 length:1473 start_codon:yes stop_codon:yes gene_type:complete
MTESEFFNLAKQGYNRIPVVLETFADLDTPLSIYLKLANRPYSYLLESVRDGERFGRYSFIGLPASSRIEVRDSSISIINNQEVERFEVEDPLSFIQSYLLRFKVASCSGLPRFCGGLVGYFSYETVRYIESKLAGHVNPDVLDLPDISLLLSEELIVVDNLSGKLYLIIYTNPDIPDAYKETKDRLKILLADLRKPVEVPNEIPVKPSKIVSEFSELDFIQAVERAKRYIFDGDIMQVVLSQRTSKIFKTSPLALYRALRNLNPSPYMFYYNFGDFHVVGASPEILVRLEGEIVTVRPIAGTRPRGDTQNEDEVLAADLLSDPKECAEHLMLMDLGRNDLGRVADIGSVQVTENMKIENYSHVMHIVSNVDGKLKPGLSAIDVLRATFPAGTVSGAPKIRAMEIIDELENSKRGVYAGAVGYLGFNGDMDIAIAIRTGVIKGGKLYVQAGAGIVADSVPKNEWIETENKAKALLKAAEIAERGLDSKLE